MGSLSLLGGLSKYIKGLCGLFYINLVIVKEGAGGAPYFFKKNIIITNNKIYNKFQEKGCPLCP
jgi:hypothetical protein